jgi:aconitate hydratase
MGVLPLAFTQGFDADSLGLDGSEFYSIPASGNLEPFSEIQVSARKVDGTEIIFPAIVRLETPVEAEYYRNGGILPTVLRNLAKK